ncbi:WS/DGAT/MGAT family O-acyltransferase [Salinifilum ghardaiensis]
MSERLTALDASFLYLEERTTPMHLGGVTVFEAPGLDYDTVLELIDRRLNAVPRYRQRVRHVPGRLARPVWVDDEDFDLTYHVRRSALPRPGDEEQLHDLVARLMSRQLDHTRPLWEMYVVEGLAGDRVAVVTKAHQALVDGVGAIDPTQVLLDDTAQGGSEMWAPRPAPGPVGLLADAGVEAVQRPGAVVENLRATAADLNAAAGKFRRVLGGIGSAAWSAAVPAPNRPLNAPTSPQRRFAVARAGLDELRAVRTEHGTTVNDVVLAVVTSALRNWLLSRGELVGSGASLRAMVPMSVRFGAESGPDSVAPYLVDLPVGEPNPTVRLHQISHVLRRHVDSGQSVAADALVALSGFAPPTLHALGARVANGFSDRLFNVLVTNVPGPQAARSVAGATMREMFPVVPLAKNQSLSIGVTSYRGDVFFGLNADRNAMSDVEVVATMLTEAVDEMRGTVAG